MEIPGLTHFNTAHIPPEVYQLIGLIIATIIGTIVYVIYLHRANRHTSFKILSVTLPEILEEDQHKYRQKMEGVFSALHRLIFSQTDKLFIEILKVDSYITIQIGSNSAGVIEKIKGIFSQIENVQLAEVEIDQLTKLTSIVGKKVVTTKSYYPVGRNDNLFASILHFMASLKDNEQGGFQIILRGVVKKEAIKSQIQTLEERSKQNNRRPTETENYETAQYQLKLQNNLFKVKINVFGNESFISDSLVSLLQTINLDTNTFTSSFEKPVNIRSRYISPETIITPFVRKGQGSYLTATELSYFLHPVPVVRGTYSSRQTKTLEASPEFLASSKENIEIGTAESGENSSQSIYFPIRNLQRHLYVVGKTGRGKSTFLTTLISSLIDKEAGSVFVFDPHGDLLLDIIQSVRKTDNIIYLNIENKNKVFTFNPLFAFQKNTFEKASIRDALLEIVQSETSDVAGQSSGVATYQRIKQILEIGIDFADAYYAWLIGKGVSPEAAVKLVSEKQLTLNDLPMLLIKEMGYIPLLKAIYKDQTTPTAIYVNKLLDKHANNQMVVEAVQTRLEQLLHPSIRLISEGNKLQLDKMVETNRAFLLPITENVYGTKGERALLQSILSMLWLVKRKNSKKRNDTYVFIDECQRGQINAIPKIIAEARKYRLFLGLSNQQLGQLKEEVKNAILGNMGTLISFTVAADDIGAGKLAPFFGSQVTEKDLANLPPHTAYLRTEGIAAKPQITFSFKTLAPKKVIDRVNLEDLNNDALELYGEDVEQIEERLRRKQGDPLRWFTESL